MFMIEKVMQESLFLIHVCSLEGLMLKLKFQYFGHLMQRADSFEKTLMLGKIENRKGKGRQRMRWLDGVTDRMDMVWVDSRSWWWTGRPGMLQFMGSQRVGHNWETELNWCTHIHRLYSVTATCRLNVEYNPFSLVAQMLKNLPAMWETQVQSWGWEDSLEKGMATYSSILVWKIP